MVLPESSSNVVRLVASQQDLQGRQHGREGARPHHAGDPVQSLLDRDRRVRERKDHPAQSIGCIDTATDGTVEVCGDTVAQLSDDALADFRARNVGFIFQHFSLVPVLTAYENVEYPLILLGMSAAPRRDRAMAMLEAVGLAEHAHRFPNELSGGQKQRVAIARALVKRPTFVLADEPTANLDSGTGAAIIALMRRIQAELQTTFIFASHDAQLISHADDIFAIRDGTLLEHRAEAER